MRYEVRRTNQVWHVFDTWAYTAVAAHVREDMAFAQVCSMNSGKK